jgi:hypothetical protein
MIMLGFDLLHLVKLYKPMITLQKDIYMFIASFYWSCLNESTIGNQFCTDPDEWIIFDSLNGSMERVVNLQYSIKVSL